MTLFTPLQALARARNQSVNGPRFGTGFCLRETRRLYGVPALYDSASEAWSRTRKRVSAADVVDEPGVLVWWVGGSRGFGHVAIATGDGYCYSVDIRRSGYFDRVPIGTITREWNLTFAGYSRDINGVQVVPDPPRATPNLDHAIDDLAKARDARKPGVIRRRIRRARQALKSIRETIRR